MKTSVDPSCRLGLRRRAFGAARQVRSLAGVWRFTTGATFLVAACCIFLLGSLAPGARAETFFFNPNGGIWSDPNNWTTQNGPMGIPTAADNATFGGNSASYTVISTGNSIQNINVGTSDLTFSLGGSLTASGGLSTGCQGSFECPEAAGSAPPRLPRSSLRSVPRPPSAPRFFNHSL